jgi:ribosomal protein S18 acetylase RimI-like enzyme
VPDHAAAPSVRIRRAEIEDWASCRDLRLRALASEPWAFGSTLERERSFTELEWKQRIAREGPEAPAATWIAETAPGPAVGMVSAALLDGRFHIFAMWVAPERRREGIAGRLLDAALGWIAETGPGIRIELQVNLRAVAARRLYSSRGFRSTGRSEPLPHTPTERIEEMVRPG